MPALDSDDLVARSCRLLLAEIVNQVNDIAATGELRDLAEALAFLAPLCRPSVSARNGTGRHPLSATEEEK